MGIFYKVISMAGGLALFLYGMRIMGDGLKNSSGSALKTVLGKVTNKTYMSFLLGMLVTCMIQSSTATIVLTVGLVGAGFLTFRQSIGIVLGANVGTSITAQIIRLMDLEAGSDSILYLFKSDNLAPIALIIGIILIMFVNRRNAKNTGTIFMGFGILFVGLMNMSAAVAGMSDYLKTFLVSFENSYIMGFLAGVLATGVIQSSSAVVGILQSVASSVGIKFCGVFAVILGVNIGDCLTTYLVSRIGAKPNQIRTVLVHIIYNVFALILVIAGLTALRFTGVLNDHIWYMTLNSGGVANVHGLFRLIPAVVLLPCSGLFAKMAEKFVPDLPKSEEEDELEKTLRELDNRLLQNPVLALGEVHNLICHMGKTVLKNYDSAVDLTKGYDEKTDKRLMERENTIDRMADAANQYLVDLSPNIASESDEHDLNYQLKALICFERIGDLCVNIKSASKSLAEADRKLSDTAHHELGVIASAVKDILEKTCESYEADDEDLAAAIEPCEEVIDELIDNIKDRHLYRTRHHLCSTTAALFYQDMLQNMERISDQCSDLGVYLLAKKDNYIRGMEHRYIHNLHHSPNREYQLRFAENYDKYFAMLENEPEKEEQTEKE